MGRFVNPGNSAFKVALASEIYIDKTGLLDFTNSVLGTKQAYICNSRPRRFGKSITADMLTAYYSKGCDSRELFMNYNIAQTEYFEKYLNKYDVIHLDMQWILMDAGAPERISGYINKNVISELADLYKDIDLRDQKTLYGALSVINSMTNNKFVIIIDEWDVLIRDEAANSSVQEEYINFLRGMFKGSEPTKYIELAFLTGILPIKKLKTQSALNNFDEYTMLYAGRLSPYIGFTEDEVRDICDRYGRNFSQVERWYDGAILPISVEQKHLTQMGYVVFIEENCIVYTDGTSCGACSEHCPTQAVAMVPYKDGLTIPHVNKEICVGCGGCEYVCPARPFRAIYIEGNPVQKEAKPFKESEEHKVEIDDFGF